MSAPIQHHLAGGIHPATFVGVTAPALTDEQDHVLWIDTSAGPPYQLNMWDQTSATWVAVGSVAGTSTGSAVDSTGHLHTTCLTFLSHSATICNNATDVLHFNTPTATFAMDDAGLTLPGGHRLQASTTP